MLSKRLLPSLCVLSLSAAAVVQNHLVLSSCPVTKPADQHYIPPAPYAAKPSLDQFWFGTDKLWTALPVAGTWWGLPHYTPNGPTYREKLAFWRQGYDPQREPRPNLTVTGRRIDGCASPKSCTPLKSIG